MSKAILVMDMPKSCRVCPLFERVGTDKYCKLLDEEIYCVDVYVEKPYWCPLKEAPGYDDPSIFPNDTNCAYAQGWNDCIDEILRGGE